MTKPTKAQSDARDTLRTLLPPGVVVSTVYRQIVGVKRCECDHASHRNGQHHRYLAECAWLTYAGRSLVCGVCDHAGHGTDGKGE